MHNNCGAAFFAVVNLGKRILLVCCCTTLLFYSCGHAVLPRTVSALLSINNFKVLENAVCGLQ